MYGKSCPISVWYQVAYNGWSRVEIVIQLVYLYVDLVTWQILEACSIF